MTTTNSKGEKKRVLVGYFDKKTSALQAIEKITTAGGLPEFYNITVEEVQSLWKEKHYPQIEKNGRQNYNAAWNYFDEKTRKMKMADIKTYHIQEVVSSAIKLGRSKSTCEKIQQLASQLCKFAIENDIIDRNYANFVEIGVAESESREPFTVPELLRIRDYYLATGDNTTGAILLLCYTGLRLDEFLAMRKSDYYNGCLHGGNKTEKGIGRTVPVPDIMVPVIEKLLVEPGDYIVSNKKGKKYDAHNWRNRNYYKTLENIGFDAELIQRRTPHSCRHTYATMCAKLKMDDKALQDILGHEDISTTKNIYTHTDEEYLKRAAQNLNFFTQD